MQNFDYAARQHDVKMHNMSPGTTPKRVTPMTKTTVHMNLTNRSKMRAAVVQVKKASQHNMENDSHNTWSIKRKFRNMH